jgi:hypothetical protein
MGGRKAPGACAVAVVTTPLCLIPAEILTSVWIVEHTKPTKTITLPRKTRLTHLESVSLSNAFFIPMGGPQVHVNSKARSMSAMAMLRQ